MLKRVFIGLVLFLIISCFGMFIAANKWRNETQQRLSSASKLIETRMGLVEYVDYGQGPVILSIHGSPGGYDGGDVQHYLDLGFRYISLSRPGYLRTPIESGRSPEEQADLFAALLDALDIDQAAILGSSGGGPATLQFAIRHPDRCWGVVLVSALTQNRPKPTGPADAFGKVIGSDIGGWLMMTMMTQKPEWIFPALDPQIHVTGDPHQFDLYTQVALGALPATIREPGTSNDFDQFSRMSRYPLEQITCPVLIVHGTSDQSAPIRGAEFAAETIPGATFLPIQDGTHLTILTHYDEVMPNIDIFLQRHIP